MIEITMLALRPVGQSILRAAQATVVFGAFHAQPV